MVNRCILCQMEPESVRHIFNECTFSKALYVHVAHKIGTPVRTGLIPTEAIIALENTEKERSILLISQFVLWREMCARTFSESTRHQMELVNEVLQQFRTPIKFLQGGPP